VRLLTAGLVLAFAAGPAWGLKTERLVDSRYAAAAGSAGIEVVSGLVFVKLSSGTPQSQVDAGLASIGATRGREFKDEGWTVVHLASGTSVADGLAQVRGLSFVQDTAPDHVYHASAAPNDPYFWLQYHMNILDMPSAWDQEQGATNKVTIAVLDSGIQGSHADLSSKLVGASQFCDPGPSKTLAGDNTACAANQPPTPACSHATQVAGAAAAATNNGFGVAGIGWQVNLLSMKIFRDQDCSPTGSCTTAGCSTDDKAVIDAINHVRGLVGDATYGKLVINLSLGAPATACDGLVETAIGNAVADGIPVIVSAGNDGAAVNAPANCASAIPVGATDQNDRIASFSSHGTELANNGVSAPGVSIVTADLSNRVTGNATGTSFSAPIVSGLAALMLARYALNVAAVKAALRNSAVDLGDDNYFGKGRVHGCRALKLAGGGDPDTCVGTSGSALGGLREDDSVIAFPNPFRRSQHANAYIKVPTSLQSSPKVQVYTSDGQFVRELEVMGARAMWDGKNTGGNEVATGVYVLRVKSGSKSKTGRIAVIR